MTKPFILGPARDLEGYRGRPPKVSWPGNAKIAISVVVSYQEGSEMAIGDGDALREPGGPQYWPMTERDLGVETMFEYGSRTGVWRLFKILDEAQVPCTFFASAQALERNPAVAREIRRAGHDVAAHGWRFQDITDLSRDEERDWIAKAYASISRTTGAPPEGWYCRYGASPNTRELLAEHGGFSWDSDSYSDDLPYWTRAAGKDYLVIPYSLATNDYKVGMNITGSPRDFERQLMTSFERLYKEGAKAPRMMTLGLHPRWSGHPARAQAVLNFLHYAKSFDGVWFARRSEIAAHWKAHHAPAATLDAEN